mgnify:CR=1 FL=1
MSKMAELDRQRGEYEKIVAIYTWFFPKQEGIPIPEKYYNLNQIVGLFEGAQERAGSRAVHC